MEQFQYVFGPVPSRRLGNSLGISPIPKKTCNYSCVYCQLGRTDKMTNQRKEYVKTEDILREFNQYQKDSDKFDVVTIVGEGEPTLAANLGELVTEVKKRTDKPVAVITNAALLTDPDVRRELLTADIVLPSLDAVDQAMFKAVDRPHGSLRFDEIQDGLAAFSREYKGQLWVEIMLIGGVNDKTETLRRFKELLAQICCDRVYINTPVRPPAESNVSVPNDDRVKEAVDILGGISIDMLSSGSFFSEIEDSYEAILSIIGRHPMNQFEVTSFLASRNQENGAELLSRLSDDPKVETLEYKGITTYRLAV